ncbi:MAG TPA: site-2 protease family protein [Vicinamibacteria bacterium]|nr:site-2 protease family protein [Vicinamibacteria bacterium]
MHCVDCGTEISSVRLSCPVCHRLVHREELERLAKEAEVARERDDPREEILSWRRALELLPPDSDQSRAIAARVSELSPVVEKGGDGKPSSAWRWAGVGAAVTFLLTKGKFLLAGLTKSGTFLSMFLSLGVYWAAFGWKFAAGLIASIYVHEMGHVAALQRLGIRASAPMFLPGLGAVVRMQQYPVDAREDARVGLAGPLWGLGAALAAAAVFYVTEAPIWGAIARVGAWINLFNLLPIWQLDGGRGFRALSKSQRFLVAGLLALLYFWTNEGLLVVLLIVAALRAFGAEQGSAGDRVAFGQFVVLLSALSALTLIHVAL